MIEDQKTSHFTRKKSCESHQNVISASPLRLHIRAAIVPVSYHVAEFIMFSNPFALTKDSASKSTRENRNYCKASYTKCVSMRS